MFTSLELENTLINRSCVLILHFILQRNSCDKNKTGFRQIFQNDWANMLDSLLQKLKWVGTEPDVPLSKYKQ